MQIRNASGHLLVNLDPTLNEVLSEVRYLTRPPLGLHLPVSLRQLTKNTDYSQLKHRQTCLQARHLFWEASSKKFEWLVPKFQQAGLDLIFPLLLSHPKLLLLFFNIRLLFKLIMHFRIVYQILTTCYCNTSYSKLKRYNIIPPQVYSSAYKPWKLLKLCLLPISPIYIVCCLETYIRLIIAFTTCECTTFSVL